MKKHKILFISHESDAGGAEQCLFDLVSQIDKRKFEAFVNLPCQGPMRQILDDNKIPFFISHTERWVPSASDRSLKHVFRFLKTLRARIWSIETKIQKHNIDLVYSNTITCIDGAIAAWRSDIPHIWHIHENLDGNHSIKSYFSTRLTYQIARFFCKNFITVSNQLANQIKTTGVDVTTIYNGVDLKQFDLPASNQIKNELGLSPTTLLIGQIGSLIPSKGVSDFIESAEKILAKKQRNDLAFLLIGSGPNEYTDFVTRKIQHSPYSRHFHLLGQRSDIPRIISELSIVVLASESEGLPRAVIETMAAKKPVIASRCGGPEEIIVDGETGFLVPVNNAHEIAEKACYLLEHPEQAQAMGRKGFLRAQKLFSLDQYIQNIEKVIIETISQRDKSVKNNSLD